MLKIQKTAALLFAVLMFVTAVIGVIAVCVTTTSAAEAVTVRAFDSGMPNRGPFAVTSDYCIRMHMAAPFTSFSVSMPTWSQKDSEATLAMYKWDESYAKTVASAPISEQRFAPLVDNAYNSLTFDAQPAGEYLIRIYDVKGQVGVWYMDKKVSNGFCYVDGKESEADWEMTVTFTETPAEPFLPVESAAEVIDGNHKAPAEYQIPEDSLLNTHKVMPDTWVFTDGLGRVSLTNKEVGDPREDKTLAMFYWTWHADLAPSGALNTTEFMKKYPDAKNDYNHSAWKGTGHYCFWNEPIYGFYRTDDAWVLRRQAELLANAGVDTIFADNTNGSMTWRTSYLALYKTWDDAQKNGAVDVPKVSYLLPFGPNAGHDEQLRAIYQDIYRPGKYQNLWFYWDGKPMMMAYNNNFVNASSNLDKEIRNYFTFRSGQPNYRVSGTAARQWGWLSVYPQALYSVRGQGGVSKGMIEQMSVGVAVNHNYKTKQITAMNGVNVMGRSYTSDYPDRYEKEGAEASKWGYQFAEQFNYALEVDPEVIFVTGWNEWHAWRQPEPWAGISNALVDQFDDEYSRDLEPTKGALKDHYYYQFVNFARQYKGANPIPTPSANATIDMTAGADQWKAVEPYYAAYIGNTDDRDAAGYGKLKYTETSGRNDIIGAQVARDGAYVYFHVECAEDITPYTDALWMNLYIDSDQENQGWNTFEYVVNKSAASEKTLVLEKFTGEGYASEKVADVEYTLDGRYLTVKIAKADLGLSGNDLSSSDDYTLNFAWTDNVHDEGDYEKFSGDIMDFYISGDVAPGGRFKYSFISTAANAAGLPEPEETESATDAPVDSATPEDTTAADAASDAATEAEAEEGCGSSVGVGMLWLAVGMALALRKRKD